MRTALRNISEVFHIFAQRTQNEGRAASVFFEGNTIYSYGHHFPLATFHDSKKKGTVVLINTTKRSVTTSGHQSECFSALSQYRQIPVAITAPGTDHTRNMEYLKREIEETAQKALNAKKNGAYWAEQHLQTVAQTNEYISFFGLSQWKKFKSLLNSKEFAAKVERQKEQAKEQARKERAKEALKIQEWIEGITDGNLYTPKQYFRLKDKQTVLTSKGVEFPLSHARLALARINDCKKNATSWHRNGSEIRVGTFHIDSIDEKGNVVAGCHRVDYSEIERFAKLTKLM